VEDEGDVHLFDDGTFDIYPPETDAEGLISCQNEFATPVAKKKMYTRAKFVG